MVGDGLVKWGEGQANYAYFINGVTGKGAGGLSYFLITQYPREEFFPSVKSGGIVGILCFTLDYLILISTFLVLV